MLACLLLLLGCAKTPATQTPVKPEEIAQAFVKAFNEGDIDSCLGMIADNIEYRQEPAGTVTQGKELFAATLQYAKEWHLKLSIASPMTVNDDKVAFSIKESGDYFTILGLEYMNGEVELHISNGKIDSFLATVNADDWKKLNDLLAGGIGIKIEVVEQGIRVTQLAKNSPAYDPGMRQGDIIIAVNKVSCSKMRDDEAQLRIYGAVGSKVLLTVVHQGTDTSVDIEVIRASLEKMQY